MITQIEIGGYRLLDEFKADFTRLTVVIGANAVGKSTLIDCLQLIAQCCDVPLNTAIGLHYGAASILTSGNANKQLTWNITFNDPSPHGRFCGLEANNRWCTRSLLGWIHLVRRIQYEVLRNQLPARGHANPFKFLEATPYRRQIFDRRQGKLTPFDEAQPSTDIVRESDSTELC